MWFVWCRIFITNKDGIYLTWSVLIINYNWLSCIINHSSSIRVNFLFVVNLFMYWSQTWFSKFILSNHTYLRSCTLTLSYGQAILATSKFDTSLVRVSDASDQAVLLSTDRQSYAPSVNHGLTFDGIVIFFPVKLHLCKSGWMNVWCFDEEEH